MKGGPIQNVVRPLDGFKLSAVTNKSEGGLEDIGAGGLHGVHGSDRDSIGTQRMRGRWQGGGRDVAAVIAGIAGTASTEDQASTYS